MSQPPDPYGSAPPAQPWYGHRPPQTPVPDNPYAPGGTPAAPPAPKRSRRGPVIAALLALIVLVGTGVYVLGGRDGDDRTATPAAKESAPPSKAPSAKPTRTPKKIPTTGELNAGREPGEARAWIVDDLTDLPRRSVKLHDLWVVGDTVVQAAYRKVTARRVSDGAELWSLPLPAPVCETPVNPTPDGKVVLVYQNIQGQQGGRCNQLRMIDLRTGKAGWHKVLPETSHGSTIIVHTAISGDTLAIAQGMEAAAYRVADGTKLYDIPKENPGNCSPDDVAGGARLLVSSRCAIAVDRSKSFGQLREIDPRTGKVLWRQQTQPGWRLGKVLSVDPAVFTSVHAEEGEANWRVVSLGPGGKLRTTIDARPKGFKHCADAGDAGEGVQNCPGTAVGRSAVHLGGTDRVGAYDLGTGKLVWGVKSGGPLDTLHPLRPEDGAFGLVYEKASANKPGGVTRFGPGGVDTDKPVLRHPEAARSVESGMFAGKLAYVGGRIVITPSIVSGDDARREAMMLSFGP